MAADRDGAKPPAAYVDRRMVASGVLLMTGGFVACLVGAAVGLAALASAGRRYVADRDEPPVVMARRRLNQARSATAAGFGAWQDYERQVRSGAGTGN
jgi:hypothetical protein